MGKRQEAYLKTMYRQFLLVLIAAAVCISLLLAGYYTFREIRVLREEKERQLDQTMFYMERIFDEVDTITSSIWINSAVQDLMRNYKDKPDYLLYRDCQNYLSTMVNNVNSIEWVDIYLEKENSLITSNSGVFYNLEGEAKEYYQDLTAATEKTSWSSDYTNHYLPYFSRSSNVIIWVRPVFYTLTGRKAGVLAVGIPVHELYNYLNVKDQTEGLVLMLGDEQMVIFSSNESTGEEYSDGCTVLSRSEGAFGITALYYYQDQLIISHLIPVLFWIGIIICLFTAIYKMIIRISSKKISRPVETLMTAMKEMEKGVFGYQIKEKREDVFGDIFRGFNAMSANLQNLVREVLEERLRKEDLRYRLLQSQINPHFLYNIFGNMIWMIEQKDYSGLERMISATAGYYKTTLNYGSEEICLVDNLKQLQNYVWIQKTRFGDRFECCIDFDDEILPLCIPNFILQPLVENAISHGAQNKIGTTEIVVTGTLDQGMLRFEIWDNGSGIERERLQDIRKALMDRSNNGKEYFALVNIARRLELKYHGKASISIDSEYKKWTKVILNMPGEEDV